MYFKKKTLYFFNVMKVKIVIISCCPNPFKDLAAKELLDRTGLIKTEKVQVEAAGGVMLMPAKAPVDDE